MASRAATSAATKRKRTASDAVQQPQPISRNRLIEYAKQRFPRSLSSLPRSNTMLFVKQTLDDNGGDQKLLIGSIVCEGADMALFAYLKEPFWINYTYGIGKELSPARLSLERFVELLEPFCHVGTDRQPAGLEALILYYFVVRGHWDGYDGNPNSLINLRTFRLACQMVENKSTADQMEDNDTLAMEYPNTVEDDVSSGSDPDKESIFVKTCKRCRRLGREESRCRTEDHLGSLKLLQGVIVKQEAELAKQDKELKRLRQHRALLTLEAEVMEHEVSKQKTELEDYDKWRKGNRRWKTVAECLLDPSVPKLSRNAKNALKQELGITD